MAYIGKVPSPVPMDASDIPANSIDNTKIIDGAITIADIADDAVTEAKLANAINSAIAANTAKTGITSGQASAIAANTAKTGITSGQASAITANTAKTGITSSQASAITANTAKVTNSTSASDLTSGTLPDARFPSILPAISGANLTGVGVDGITSSADATAITIDSSENVGIGVTPLHKLHVEGDMRLDGNFYGKSNHTTELGSYSSGMVKRVRMAQGGEIHFGDTTTTNAFGITEGTWDAFGDYDRMGLYVRNELKVYGNSNGLRLTLNGVNGNMSVVGAFSKGSGSFRIPHPLPALTDTKDLVHSFIEGPQADLIYRGVVTLSSGSATVNIDTEGGMTEGTFVLLCGNVSCFTTNESNWDAVKASVTGNVLTIESENASSTAKVSWLVIGERIDQHMLDTDWTDASGKVIVEPDKAVDSAEMADK